MAETKRLRKGHTGWLDKDRQGEGGGAEFEQKREVRIRADYTQNHSDKAPIDYGRPPGVRIIVIGDNGGQRVIIVLKKWPRRAAAKTRGSVHPLRVGFASPRYMERPRPGFKKGVQTGVNLPLISALYRVRRPSFNTAFSVVLIILILLVEEK